MRKHISTLSKRIGIGVVFTMIAAGEAANISQQYERHWRTGLNLAYMDLMIDARPMAEKCAWQNRLPYETDMTVAGLFSFVAPFTRWGFSETAIEQSLPMLGAFPFNAYAMRSGAAYAFDAYCSLPRSAPGEKSQDRLTPTKPFPTWRQNDYTI